MKNRYESLLHSPHCVPQNLMADADINRLGFSALSVANLKHGGLGLRACAAGLIHLSPSSHLWPCLILYCPLLSVTRLFFYFLKPLNNH